MSYKSVTTSVTVEIRNSTSNLNECTTEIFILYGSLNIFLRDERRWASWVCNQEIERDPGCLFIGTDVIGSVGANGNQM